VRSGVNAGDASVIEKEYPFTIIGADTLMARFKDDVIPKFIQVFLATNLGKLILSRYITGATNKHVSPHSLNNIEVPVIDPIDQKSCIKIFEEGLNQKVLGEIESSRLLESIDKYMLNELGIDLPRQLENKIENRMFKTNWQRITGNRFDPKKYSKDSERLIQSIEKSTLRKVPLKSLIVHSISGDWGLDEKDVQNEKLYSKCLVIRATEFDNDFNLNIENTRVKFRYISQAKLKKLDIRLDDLLLEKSGGSPDQPVGRIAILEDELLKNQTIGYSNFIHKIRVNISEIIPTFLFCFLKVMHNIKLTDVMQSQTSGIRNLILREYWNQNIILPDKTRQKEIADNIYRIRAEAKRIKIKAYEDFEKTKKEIENLFIQKNGKI
jgi:restriction endonuclease S subunit